MKLSFWFALGLVGLSASAARAQFSWVTNTDNVSVTITSYTGTDTALSIPASINGLAVTGIGEGAFNSSYSLTLVTIPEGVVNIGNQAFYACYGLIDITLPASVNHIGSQAFGDCFSLTNFIVDADNPAYSSLNGVLYDKTQTTLIAYPAGAGNSYVIPPGVTTIGTEAFDNCTRLTSIIIPPTVTTIGAYAFAASGLTASIIPGSVTSLGAEAFLGCASLTSITLPASLTSLPSGLFIGCSSLTQIIIPATVVSLGAEAFLECTNLTSVYFMGNAPAADTTTFTGDAQATAFYLPLTAGWSATFAGIPATPWLLPHPLALNTSLNLVANAGFHAGSFGFTVSSSTQSSVLVETCTNLANPVWTPLQNVTLTNGTAFFSDPQAASYSSRFYRVSTATHANAQIAQTP